MIILLGPDGTGKTTLAKKLEQGGMRYYHFTKGSNYKDYILPLCKLELWDAVLDRHAICELPYSICMNRQFKFTMKQWHNILLLTLIQSPLILLCTHKPSPLQYDEDQYLPYEKWDECLDLYRNFLNTNYIMHVEYDYAMNASTNLDDLVTLTNSMTDKVDWWRDHWVKGYGCIGSTSPRFLLVAERMGPNNMNNIPFEGGPTGYMLSEMLHATKTPLGVLTVTNMVKSFRRDTRAVNDSDIELLREEITHLRPEKVVFMGTPAKRGIPLARELGCEADTIVHLGALSHRGVKDMSGYHNEWRKILSIVPTVRLE